MKTIQLTQGKVALVDDADFDWLNQWKWQAHKMNCGIVYATRSAPRSLTKRRAVAMHQLIAETMGFCRPDHKDGNGLNNQRENLRPATRSQNAANQGVRVNNSSGFKGVNWSQDHKQWVARICKNGKSFFLGYFDCAGAAAKAYDKKAVELFGEFARLNFP